jgi:hypothetical protein
MAMVTQLVGFILLVIGAGTWLYVGMGEFTALIPAVLGLLLLLAGTLAERREAVRRHAMHAALLVALLGLLGTAPTALGTGAMGDASDTARIEAVLTAIALGAYLALGVRSFVGARRRR